MNLQRDELTVPAEAILKKNFDILQMSHDALGVGEQLPAERHVVVRGRTDGEAVAQTQRLLLDLFDTLVAHLNEIVQFVILDQEVRHERHGQISGDGSVGHGSNIHERGILEHDLILILHGLLHVILALVVHQQGRLSVHRLRWSPVCNGCRCLPSARTTHDATRFWWTGIRNPRSAWLRLHGGHLWPGLLRHEIHWRMPLMNMTSGRDLR
mmetsp:Transcript_1490/g.4075  ORF Transcript_1490/g.4075 Transcript_1490/m.4075 type:complete len:211 (-) Transcript_1490:372-1004(-)